MAQSVSVDYPALVPAIYVSDAKAAIDFYQRAFGAELFSISEFEGRVFNATLGISGSVFALGDASPEFGISAKQPGDSDTTTFHLHAEDVDGVWARAIECGATVINEPMTRFHGWHSGAVRDPFGHRWAIAKQVEQLSDDELYERTKAAVAAGLKS